MSDRRREYLNFPLTNKTFGIFIQIIAVGKESIKVYLTKTCLNHIKIAHFITMYKME